MKRLIDLDELLQYPLRRGSEHYDEKNADPHFLFGVESVLEYAQTLPTLTQPNNWISVEDRLPEKPQYNWVLITGKFLEGGYMVPHIEEYRHGVWFVDCYDEPFEKFCMVKVTHWQPLPEPPEED